MRFNLLDPGVTFHRQQTIPKVNELSSTSLSVKIETAGMAEEPTTYTVLYQRWTKQPKDGGVPSGSEITVNSSTNPITITGLIANGTYVIKTRTSSDFGTGNTLMVVHVLKGVAEDPAKTSSTDGTSFLQLVGGKTKDNKYKILSRQFNAIQLPTKSTQTITQSGVTPLTNAPAYHTVSYYAFGTSFFFPPITTQDPQEAGFGFFMSDDLNNGYVLMVKSSVTAAVDKKSVLSILKIQGQKIIDLTPKQTDSQRLDTIYGGELHTVDIKVKVGGTSSSDPNRGTVVITAFVDGFSVTVTDKNQFISSKPNSINEITKRVAFIAASGTASFDYAYGTAIDADSYDRQGLDNFYRGRYSDDYLITKYGDLLYVSNSGEDQDGAETDEAYDELGTTAREIIKREVTFTSAPAYPNDWNLGINNSVKILDKSQDGFRGSIFVLNNTSAPTALADGAVRLLQIEGATIGIAGQQTYDTEPESQYSVKEPVSFESTWIQTEEDAKNLAEFIKSKVVNKSKIIQMSVFGNPLISVGDIITIDFPYHNLDDTKRILVTSVTNEYNNGLTTRIVGRTI